MDVLLAHPDHRHTARRAQIVARCPYAEIRDNLVAAELVPVDLLRCKLSFFVAIRFDPHSHRWVRITMYKGAPFPDELDRCEADDRALPPGRPGARAVIECSLNEVETYARRAARGAA